MRTTDRRIRRKLLGLAAGLAVAAIAAASAMAAGMQGSGSGGMMGLVSAPDGSGWSRADSVMVSLMGVLMAIAIGALAALRPWRRSGAITPRKTLHNSSARGAIDQQEFEDRLAALGGPT